MPQSLFAAHCPGCFPILMQNHQPCKRQHHIITCNGHVPHRVPKQTHYQFDDSNSNVHQRDQKREQQRAFLRIAQHCFCLWQMLFDVQSKRSFLSKTSPQSRIKPWLGGWQQNFTRIFVIQARKISPGFTSNGTGIQKCILG